MKVFIRIFLSLCLLTVSCSPKLNSKDFSAPIMDLKPDLEKDRDFAKLLQAVNQFEMEWKGQIPTSEVHEVIQGLLDIATKYKKDSLKTTAALLYKKYYSESVGTKVSFFKTPYYSLFQNEALPNVREAVTSTGVRVDKDLERVLARIKVQKTEFKWPPKATYRESMKLFETFLDEFVSIVTKMKLLPEFEQALVKEVKDEKKYNWDYLEKQLKAIEGDKSLASILEILKGMVKEFEIPLDNETTAKLEEGKKLSIKIEEIKDELSAFSGIVAVWLMLDKKDRETYFTPISAALYKFMSGKSDQDLVCLVEKTCPKFFSSVIRDFAILPQLKKFGPENIKKTLNEKTHGFVLVILEERLLSVINNLDARITKKVMKNVVKAKDKLDTLKKNAQGFTKDKFLDWLKKNMDMNDEITMAYEYPTIQVDLQKRAVTFVIPDQARNSITARSIGASIGSNAKILETEILTEKHSRRVIIEQVNKVMGLGGVPTAQGPTAGLIRNFENERETFDVGKALDSLLTYGVPDKIELSGPYTRREGNDMPTVSALSQVEFGEGLLALMSYLRDWKKNSFDSQLGHFKASHVFGSDSGDSAADPILFSKTDFFGMVTAQFLNWISNLNKGYSQIGLVSDAQEIVWLNEYGKYKDKTLLYGIYTDFVNGQRINEVNLEPMVKLIRILKSVQEVVEGIEKTQFKELLKKDMSNPECKNPSSPKCPTFAQVIGKQIDEVKKILLPLGNTIATKFRKQKETGNPGQAWGQIKLPNMEYEEKDPVLKHQLLVIEGLIYIYESTKIESYLWAAKETYSYIQKFYNPKTNFFEMDSKVASVPIVIQMLRTFKPILPHLDETEKTILKEKIKIWEFALEKLQ